MTRPCLLLYGKSLCALNCDHSICLGKIPPPLDYPWISFQRCSLPSSLFSPYFFLISIHIFGNRFIGQVNMYLKDSQNLFFLLKWFFEMFNVYTLTFIKALIYSYSFSIRIHLCWDLTFFKMWQNLLSDLLGKVSQLSGDWQILIP